MTAAHLVALLLAQSAPELAPRAEIELIVVQEGVPVEGADLLIDGERLGTTDEQGALVAQIPAGRSEMVVRSGETTLVEVDLLTDAGELILIIATIIPGGEPELVIESSGTDSVIASEAGGAAARQPRDEPREKQPPGALVGTIRSADDAETIPRAQLFFSGITIEVATDEQGEFSVELPSGVYSVSIVHPRFSPQTLENIRVIPEREVRLDIELTPAGVRLQDYVVTAPYVEGSIASVVEQQRAASGVSDVLGAAQISATGDSNAAQALTRVTGLTVEDGKFVLIRGQPSRFTLALFNGSPLPSPEPLLQVVPLDLFPTGVLQGIEVQKGFTPDKPGSFGAGLVELTTRAVPEEPFLTLTLGAGYNSQSTFQDGLTYQGGSRDFLSFDDGTRALPGEVIDASDGGARSLSVLPLDEQIRLAQTFPNILEQDARSLPPDARVGLSSGGKMAIFGDGTLGAIVTGSYRNQWRFQERIQRSLGLSRGELGIQDDTIENRTDNDITLSGLLTLSALWDDHQVSSNTFVVNQTQQRTEFVTGRLQDPEILDVQRSLLSWIERSLVAQQITGRHDFEWLVLEYRGLIANAQRDAPDRRTYEFGKTEEQDDFIVQRGRALTRSYSFVDDVQIAYGIDLSFPLVWSEKSLFKPTLKVGFDRAEVRRDAGEQRFLWDIAPTGDPSIGPPEEVFNPNRLENGGLDFTDASVLGADDYTGDSTVTGAYAQLDLDIAEVVRVVGGVRWETADYLVESFQLASLNSEVTPSGFEQTDLLPALLITWFASDELQVRATYGRSLSRPVFNELAPSFFFDPDTGQQFQGNPDLVPTTIDGYEARVEWYPTTTESATLGVFRKDYTNPLEKTFLAIGGGGLIATFQNADEAVVTGIEIGGRFEWGRFREWVGGPDFFENTYVSANAAILNSEVTLEDPGVATSSVRNLQGQADLVINVQAGYDGEAWDVTVSYNRVGSRLQRVGIFEQPDILQDPFDSLDVNITWQATDRLKLRVSGNNLVNPSIRWTQALPGEDPIVFREFKQGRGASAVLSYTFD